MLSAYSSTSSLEQDFSFLQMYTDGRKASTSSSNVLLEALLSRELTHPCSNIHVSFSAIRNMRVSSCLSIPSGIGRKMCAS